MPIGSHEWRCIGAVTFPSGVPVFTEDLTNPSKAAIAGLYPLTFDNNYVYIGRTTNLRRPFGTSQTHVYFDENVHEVH
jgi:hypothetical protein